MTDFFQSLISASRELDFDYDMAMLTALRVEYKILENELKRYAARDAIRAQNVSYPLNW